MKQYFLAVICTAASLDAPALWAQTGNLYVDYQKYFNEVLHVSSFNGLQAPKTVTEMQDSAKLIMEETAAAGIPVRYGGSKLLTGETIFAARKKSVFILGKLLKRKPGADISFDLTGTAFAISEDGVCVTNYHVLKNIILEQETADSVYFILTHDKQVYFIERLLAYSQNNDIAVFKVQTQGKKLIPIPLGKPAQVGATVYCLSHPVGFFYYFSKGMVARNVTVSAQQAAAGYNPDGKPPIRMEITADYGIGSSGGPIFDKYGHLAGIVSSTIPLGNYQAGNVSGHQQMVIRDAIPLTALQHLLKN